MIAKHSLIGQGRKEGGGDTLSTSSSQSAICMWIPDMQAGGCAYLEKKPNPSSGWKKMAMKTFGMYDIILALARKQEATEKM